jgi:hypothetical protein
LQAAVVEYLRLRGVPGLLFIAVPNGGSRDVREAAQLKRQGVLAGAADILLWCNGKSHALELKAPGGRLSEPQAEFLSRFESAGGYSACAQGLDAALATLLAWELIT